MGLNNDVLANFKVLMLIVVYRLWKYNKQAALCYTGKYNIIIYSYDT